MFNYFLYFFFFLNKTELFQRFIWISTQKEKALNFPVKFTSRQMIFNRHQRPKVKNNIFIFSIPSVLNFGLCFSCEREREQKKGHERYLGSFLCRKFVGKRSLIRKYCARIVESKSTYLIIQKWNLFSSSQKPILSVYIIKVLFQLYVGSKCLKNRFRRHQRWKWKP